MVLLCLSRDPKVLDPRFDTLRTFIHRCALFLPGGHRLRVTATPSASSVSWRGAGLCQRPRERGVGGSAPRILPTWRASAGQ